MNAAIGGLPSWTIWFGLIGWLGATLLLSRLPWFRTPRLVERLRPYVPTPAESLRRAPLLAGSSVVDVITPVLGAGVERLLGVLGVNDEVEARLARSGAGLDANGFRLRQAAWASFALVTATALAIVAPVPAAVGLAVVIASPVLAVLVTEQQLSTASADWQHRVKLELPLVIEQLGMLLSSGYSLSAAIGRLGQRNNGACATELALVSARLRQGTGEIEALREWARRADVIAVDRLVSVLALNWEAGDLGPLISAEARSVRRDVQREQIELIERRAQQVWIPVTIATLLPGVIFMAVPFVDAMGRLTGR